MLKKDKKFESRLSDLEHQLKRALADYANLQKRVEQEKSDYIDLGKAQVLKKLIDVQDTLDRAATVEDSQDFEALRQGLEIAKKDFRRILQEEGLEEIGIEGEEFDPNIHEAIDVEEGEENKVSKVLEKGYMYKQKIIRPAKVKVTKKGQAP